MGVGVRHFHGSRTFTWKQVRTEKKFSVSQTQNAKQDHQVMRVERIRVQNASPMTPGVPGGINPTCTPRDPLHARQNWELVICLWPPHKKRVPSPALLELLPCFLHVGTSLPTRQQPSQWASSTPPLSVPTVHISPQACGSQWIPPTWILCGHCPLVAGAMHY